MCEHGSNATSARSAEGRRYASTAAGATSLSDTMDESDAARRLILQSQQPRMETSKRKKETPPPGGSTKTKTVGAVSEKFLHPH